MSILADKRMSTLTPGDNLVFDDDVPHVIASRFRLARTLALTYGADVELYEVEGLPAPHLRWLLTYYLGDLGLSIPTPLMEAKDFLTCVRLVHELLEVIFRKGLRLNEILSESTVQLIPPIEGGLASGS